MEWRYTEEGEKVRVSTRTGRIIPVPEQETEDFVEAKFYKGKVYRNQDTVM